MKCLAAPFGFNKQLIRLNRQNLADAEQNIQRRNLVHMLRLDVADMGS